MTISVIAIFYNSEKTICKCIDSVLNQKGNFDLELIAVDDCSKDSTLLLLEEYDDSRIKVIKHKKNKGISSARNTGLNHVTGDAFLLIDGDDYLPDGALEELCRNFSPEVDWVQGSYRIVDEDGNEVRLLSYKDKDYKSKEEIIECFNDIEFIYTHNRLINSQFKDILFPTGKAHEDRFWNVRAFNRVSRIITISAPTYNYVSHTTSFSNKSRASKMYIDSALELVEEIDTLDTCWTVNKETFIITAIEKNLYLWRQDKKFRRSIVKKLQKRDFHISTAGFPRFTKMIHYLINNGFPDSIIEVFASVYRGTSRILKRQV